MPFSINVSLLVAYIFVVGITLVGLWDVWAIFVASATNNSVTYEIRHSWLRYLMAVNIAGFLILHFWPRSH